jgi:ParB family transcriptional regulator, chromosome partitioning protein
MFQTSMSQAKLNVVEKARAYTAMIDDLGLTPKQVGERVGSSRSTVESLVGLLALSDEILGFLERGELSARHGRALLRVKDLEVRAEFARKAAQEGWSVEALDDRVQGKVRKQRQDRDETALQVAEAWGNVLGVEVGVRTLPRGGGFQVEIAFNSPKAALATAARLGDRVSS